MLVFLQVLTDFIGVECNCLAIIGPELLNLRLASHVEAVWAHCFGYILLCSGGQSTKTKHWPRPWVPWQRPLVILYLMWRLKPLDDLLKLHHTQAPQTTKYLLLLLDLVNDLAIQAQNSHPSKKQEIQLDCSSVTWGLTLLRSRGVCALMEARWVWSRGSATCLCWFGCDLYYGTLLLPRRYRTHQPCHWSVASTAAASRSIVRSFP